MHLNTRLKFKMFVDTSNDLYIVAPPTVVVGDKTMIKCRASKNKYLNDIKWIHTFNNEESQISINESE